MTRAKAWGLAFLLCVAIPSADFFLNRIVKWRLGLYEFMFTMCGMVAIVAVLLGVVGGRARDWKVTIGGATALILLTHIYDCLEGTRRPIIPTGREFLHLLLFFGIVLVAALPAHAICRARPRLPQPGHCGSCGYNLTGNTSGVCPECGTKIEPAAAEARTEP